MAALSETSGGGAQRLSPSFMEAGEALHITSNISSSRIIRSSSSSGSNLAAAGGEHISNGSGHPLESSGYSSKNSSLSGGSGSSISYSTGFGGGGASSSLEQQRVSPGSSNGGGGGISMVLARASPSSSNGGGKLTLLTAPAESIIGSEMSHSEQPARSQAKYSAKQAHGHKVSALNLINEFKTFGVNVFLSLPLTEKYFFHGSPNPDSIISP